MSEKSLAEPEKQLTGDMDVNEFKKYGYKIIDWIADYIQNIEKYPVLSQVKPGDIKDKLPKSPPYEGEDMEKIFKDFKEVIMPGITHWNSPNFFAYFAISASMPGILGELLISALNQQGMLWKTSPALTELEEVVLLWLRQMLGLKENYFGIIYDTASISTLHAIACAREALNLRIREEGMAGRKDLLPLRLYASEEAHTSVEKAAITLGLGQQGLRKIAADGAFQMDLSALQKAIEEDIKLGYLPFCVVATVGTTPTTSIDPVALIANICKKYNMWLHVDAAYGGMAAIVPEMIILRDGWNSADSIVVNPHKWLFTPLDLSAFYTKRPDILKHTFNLTSEYLKTDYKEVRNLMDYGIQLGRRFRALKLWMIMKYFGEEGLKNRIREHIRIAKELGKLMDRSTEFHCLPINFSMVCFRYYPKDLKDEVNSNKQLEKIVGGYLDEVNETLMHSINASGKAYLSHTRVKNKFTLRFSIGNIRTTENHVMQAWELLQSEAKRIDKEKRNKLTL